MTFTVLKFSQPASPRRDITLAPCWRISWPNVSDQHAQRLLDDVPDWKRDSYKIVPSNQVRNFV